MQAANRLARAKSRSTCMTSVCQRPMSSNCGTTLETTAPHLNNKCCNHYKFTCVVIMPCTVHALSCMQHSPVVATAKQSNNTLGVGTLPLESVKRSKLVLLCTFCHSCSTDTQNMSSYSMPQFSLRHTIIHSSSSEHSVCGNWV